METKNNSLYSLIGGILFSALSLFQLISLIRFFSFTGMLLLAGFVVTAVALFMKKRDFLPIVGIGLLTFAELISFFKGFSTRRYYVSTYSYFSGTFEHFNFFTILPSLFMFAAYAFLLFLLFCAFTNSLPKQKTLPKKLWFLPAVLGAVSFVSGLLIYAVISMMSGGYWIGGMVYHNFFSIVKILLLIAGLLLTGMWLATPADAQIPPFNGMQSDAFGNANTSGGADAFSNANTFGSANAFDNANMNGQNQAPYAYGVNAPIRPEDGYCDLVKHILLLLFTFGIWYFIWIYRTTRYLNRVEGAEYRNPTYKVLLCIFVPFYLIYWVYQSAQRVDRLAASRGVNSDLTVLCLILAIFVGIIPPMLMQEKLNSIIDVETGKTPRQPNFQQASNGPAGFQQTSGNPAGFQQASGNPAGFQQASGNPTVFQQAPAGFAPSQDVPQEQTNAAAPKNGSAIAEELKSYKELLDSGIITQEEFDAKKKQLLNL